MVKENMTETVQFELFADKNGMIWDLLLYVPTVVALASISASLWYGGDHNTSYLLFFLACFFFIVGFNRIFDTRLMMLPKSPLRLVVGDQSVILVQKDGNQVSLVKNLKYFHDYAGKSFGISGLDGSGKQLQYVFHKGQFGGVEKFEFAQATFKNRIRQ